MTDKELLEKAAKAAGFSIVGKMMLAIGGGEVLEWFRVFEDGRFGTWNPLTDDGDALRLAVRLNLDIEFLAEPDGVEVWVCATWSDEPVSQTEEGGKDLLAATRRAIVRAAAAIGETME